MKPPMCSYCGARFDPFKTEGTTLQFAISAEDEAANQHWEESRRPGHPKGLHWLCAAHVEVARGFVHLLWPEARAKMEEDGLRKERPVGGVSRHW